MHSMLVSCRQPVCKSRLSCVGLGLLSSWCGLALKGLLLNRGIYTQFVSYFTPYFSTLFSSHLSPLVSYFYPASTGPTNVTTNIITFIKHLAVVEGLNI
jgi:hypothetical protein